MSTAVTSREELLEEAYKTAQAYGLAGLSVRGLAKACGVSVGAVYNYFPSKSELTVATIELFFYRALYLRLCRLPSEADFGQYCRGMYAAMADALEVFRERWLRGINALPEVEMAAARCREKLMFEHALRGLHEVFEHDPRIDRVHLPAGVDGEAVCRFVFDNMLGMLKSTEANPEVLFWVLESALYSGAGAMGR